MKPALEPVSPGQGDWHARRDIFRKAGMIAGGEPPPGVQAIGARRKPDRTLGRNVNEIWTVLLDALCDIARANHRELDFAVSGERHRSEPGRRQECEIEPRVRRLALKIAVCVDDAINLRLPGVRCDQDAHQDVTEAMGTLEELD